MKVKSLFAVAFAAMFALVACNKNEVSPNPDAQSKSVSIKLANVQSAIAARSSQGAVETGTTAKLNTFTIFFVDGAGTFHEGYAAEDLTKTNALSRTFTDPEDISTFHYVDPVVTKVIVVGNPTWTVEPADEDALKAESVAIAGQQDVDNLVLIGEALLVKSTAEDDGVEGHTNNYEASVQIEPLVARLEIAAFRYDQVAAATERDYASMTLNHLAVNKYYDACTYACVASGLQEATISGTTVWSFLENLTAAWHNDGSMNITLNAAGEYTDDVDVDTENVYAYNVFAGTAPQLVLGMTGTKADNTTAALYLATSSLGVTTFEAGHVYRMDIDATATPGPIDKPFAFNDGNLKNPDRCVDVTVKVLPWTVVYVTPEFN